MLLTTVRRNANSNTRNLHEVKLAEELNLAFGTSQHVEYVLYATIVRQSLAVLPKLTQRQNYDGMGSDGGHYTCYCRDPHDHTLWHWFSDAEKPRRVQLADVLSLRAACNVAMAWYVRRTADLEHSGQPLGQPHARGPVELPAGSKVEVEAESGATIEQLQARLLARYTPIPTREQRWWVQAAGSNEWHRLATWIEDFPDDIPLLQRLRLERVAVAGKK